MLIVCFCAIAAVCGSCDKNLLEYNQGDIRVKVEKGTAYLHDFPLFLGIERKNAPQMAIWVEDTAGNYVATIYVTGKIANQSWSFAGGNRRKEALPCWCYARGVRYGDGLYLPTKSEPLTDGVSGATPRESFEVKMTPLSGLKHFVVKVEVNHSTDFNEYYPKSAKEGDKGYSGGKMGSGQPAVVYAAEVNLESGEKEFKAVLIGHSSPDGSNGDVFPDVTKLTTALRIIKEIIVSVK